MYSAVNKYSSVFSSLLCYNFGVYNIPSFFSMINKDYRDNATLRCALQKRIKVLCTR